MDTPMAEMDDRSLVERYLKDNDLDAMGVLFERHADMAYRTALRVMRNASDAEEAVQAAFVNALREVARYRGGYGVSVWLMKIVVGTCNNKIRESVRRRKREELATMEQDMTAPADDERALEMGETVKTMLERLPDRYRMPLWLHHHEGMAFRDVAAILSVSEVTLRTHVKRGLDMLRDSLARAGVSLPVTSMLATFPSMPVETAPASLVGSISDIIHGVGRFAEAASAAGGSTFGAGSGVSAAKVAWIAAATLGVTAVGGMALWMSQPSPVPASKTFQSKVIFSSDFNVPAAPKEVQLKPGSSWRYLSNGGIDGSGCMETDGRLFEAILDIPGIETPLLLTYTEAIVPPNESEGYAMTLSWEQYGRSSMLKNLARMHITSLVNGQRGEWVEWRLFITDQWICGWQHGRITSFMAFEKKQGSRLMWTMRGRHRVDGMQIRTIRPEELPDVSQYLKALQKIPPAQRTGTVPLPDVPPTNPGKPITVLFTTPGE